MVDAAIVARAQHNTFGYTIQPPALWTAVSRWLRANHCWEVKPDELVFTGNLVTACVNGTTTNYLSPRLPL
jgi:bifunctional pyridoxal-dependent enzyme with beta-cystathionase and maltose regulon repressor activities